MVSKTCTVVVGIFVIAALVVSCADVPSTGPTIKDQRSLYRFINAASDLTSATLSVDGGSVGAVAYQGNSQYIDFPAGSRRVIATGGAAPDTGQIAMDTDQKGTVVILPKRSTDKARLFLNVRERRVFDPTGVDTAATVVVANTSPDMAIDVSLVGANTYKVANVVFAEAASNLKSAFVPAGDYTINVTQKDSTTVLATSTVSLSLKRRYTTVVMGTGGALAVKQLGVD
jgi:hypothetical protein